jgi:hypothetical protein
VRAALRCLPDRSRAAHAATAGAPPKQDGLRIAAVVQFERRFTHTTRSGWCWLRNRGTSTGTAGVRYRSYDALLSPCIGGSLGLCRRVEQPARAARAFLVSKPNIAPVGQRPVAIWFTAGKFASIARPLFLCMARH